MSHFACQIITVFILPKLYSNIIDHLLFFMLKYKFTCPAKTVFAPNLALATAWLAPFPPFFIKESSDYKVSPSAGKWWTIKNKSKLAEPTTHIWYLLFIDCIFMMDNYIIYY